MNRLIGLLLLCTAFTTTLAAGSERVRLHTNVGDIVIEVLPEKAPKSVANFLAYARAGHYDGTIFHRVIPKFMIQGGGFTATYSQKPTRAPIANEANNNLKNTRGSVAMARTSDPHSATAQFFVNVADNAFLDHTAETPRGWGYAVFGQVVEGMETVEKIETGPTGAVGPFAQDAPVTPVVIEKCTIESDTKADKPEGHDESKTSNQPR
jgi:cyclophilin family peptidyl-prolyl cis-trans isomerase